MTIRSTATRFLGTSTLAFATLAAQPALAQDADVTGAQETAAAQLNTIIVTANRREENLQDVAVSAATLDADTVKTIFDAGAEVTALAARVPGLFVESSNGRAAPRFYIRGLGNTDFDLAASQPVSVVMDEIVLENVTLKAFPIFDVERIEVLRGPQGTLFGRNTPAGIVKIDTARPGDEFAARFSASYGSFNSLSLDGGVTVPIAPGVASLRVSGLYQHRDDWIDNGFTGWNGEAAIEWPEHGLRVTLSARDSAPGAEAPTAFCLVYRPPAGDAFCFEPITHPIDAFHLDERPGLRVLAPGESMVLHAAWRVQAIPSPA